MSKITIWHNPRCSKSREAMSILEDKNCDIEIVKYLEVSLTKDDIKNILNMLGVNSSREWMRTKESIYKELNLHEENDEERLIEAMIKHPKLIERPVIIKESTAIIGRPTSIIDTFIS
jgi:arsenate reductase